MDGLKILLSEQDPDLAEWMATVLSEDLGATVATASDGSLVRQLLGQDRYDVVVADRSMIGLDDDEGLLLVRACQPSATILVSSAFTPNDEELAASGVAEVLIKPYRADELIRAIKRHCP
jgi:DNA-binding response OmpR family regulator